MDGFDMLSMEMKNVLALIRQAQWRWDFGVASHDTIGGLIKPDLAAPGVNVSGPSIGRRNQDSIPMTTRTGTSVAAAHVAGAVANLLSWGIIEGHNIAMSEATVKAFLIRGAKRNPACT